MRNCSEFPGSFFVDIIDENGVRKYFQFSLKLFHNYG